MEWVHFKDAFVAAAGLSRDSLHVLIGTGIFGLIAVLLRCKLRNPIPWLCVFALEFTNESLDLMAHNALAGSLDWGASLHDFGYTLLLPTLAMVIGCAARLLPRPVPRRRAHARRSPARAMAVATHRRY